MRKPGPRLGGILVGLIVQVPATVVLLGEVFDMHNRMSAFVSILFPYAAIADRLSRAPYALMIGVLIVTALQYPLYGAVIGFSRANGSLRPALGSLVSIHAIASVVAIYMRMAKIM